MFSKLLLVYYLISTIICQNVDIRTSSGVVRGRTIQLLGQNVNQFIGIPYAQPPVGQLRFAKPKPIDKPSQNVIDATKRKNICWPTNPDQNQSLPMNEDCLFLNIWTQSQNMKPSTVPKPVMFWIHGGGLVNGSAMDPLFNGSVLATYDVVLAAVNYRLGAFGFLYGNDSTAPGNVGFYDQLMALKWVRENIHLFGGDKDQITIFGESAGSWSTSAHIISPESKGLFKRAIMQSGSVFYTKTDLSHTPDRNLKVAKDAAQLFNCTDDQWLQCLRKVDAKQLANANVEMWKATVETAFLPITVREAFELGQFNKDIDLIAGVTKDEGSILIDPTEQGFIDTIERTRYRFANYSVDYIMEYYLKNVNTSDSEAIKHKIWDFFGDISLKCPTYLFAKTYAKKSNTSNVYFYEWTHTIDGVESEKEFGVPHESDVPFIFGLQLLEPKNNSKENLVFVQNIVKYWTDFAKHGTTTWPQMLYQNKESTAKSLGLKEYLVYDHFGQCDHFWESCFI